MDYRTLLAELPAGVEPGYDGMEIELVSDGDQALHFIYLVGVPRPGRQRACRCAASRSARALKMLLGWVLIFAVAFVVFALKDDFLALGNRMLAETRGGVEARRLGRRGRASARADDGHFWVDGRGQRPAGALPGRQRRHDDHASRRDTAERVGIAPSGGFQAMVADRQRHRHGRSRPRRDDSRSARSSAAMSPSTFRDAFGDMNVIGMNFLSTLSRLGRRGADPGAAAVRRNR